MMPKLRVFISYSFQDTANRIALSAGLTGSDFEVRFDTGQMHTHELHKAISSNLNWCDIVVPIVTTNWLVSHECRDELVRANERRKIIVPFRHESVSNDGPPKLPWYLTENLSIMWNENGFQRALDDLRAKLQLHFDDIWRASCYKDIRVIGDEVQKSESVQSWKAVLCQRVLALAKSQLHNILVSDECTFPVAHEQAYLRFAEPIFGQAKSIIAICIASISTFWTNPDFSKDAGLYLRNQRVSADFIMRLFVFDSAEELAHFRAILQKHHETYGKQVATSGVFLCSTDSYCRLLKRWSLSSDDRALHQDFGLLSFGESGPHMHATLDNREFRYDIYDDQGVTFTSYRLISEHFEALRGLELGEIDKESITARWSPEWSRDDRQLAEAVSTIFQEKHQPTTHIVLIKAKVDCEEIAEYIRMLIVRFYKQRDALKIRSITMKRRCDLSMTDGRYAAPLLILQSFDYYLAMTFDDEAALRHYYQHEVHSLERENLYILLNNDVKPVFEEASSLSRGQVQERASLFSRIEKSMQEGGYIQRIDVRNDDPLVYLLNRED